MMLPAPNGRGRQLPRPSYLTGRLDAVDRRGPGYPQQMDWPTLIFTLLAETPLPAPTPSPVDSGAAPMVTATPVPTGSSGGSGGGTKDGPSEGFALLTALIGAAAGIGGAALSQVISGKNESKRLVQQNNREDAQRKHDELKLAYSGLVRNLNEYVNAVEQRRTGAPGIEKIMERSIGDPSKTQRLQAKLDDLAAPVLALATTIRSQLGVLDLLGQSTVVDAGNAYFDFVAETGSAESAATSRQELDAALRGAMRESLAGAETTPGK